jgi:hypothetical protein
MCDGRLRDLGAGDDWGAAPVGVAAPLEAAPALRGAGMLVCSGMPVDRIVALAEVLFSVVCVPRQWRSSDYGRSASVGCTTPRRAMQAALQSAADIMCNT